MININELRQKITARGLDVVADTDVLELLDRLEAAERERDTLRAKVAERDKLLAALQRIADGQEMSGVFTFSDVVLRYQEIARAAIARATGEQT